MLAKLLSRIDPYIAAIFGCVALASLLPARGATAEVLDYATDAAIAVLFFLYGARLSPKDTWEGVRNVKLQLVVLGFTFCVFPLIGLLSRVLVPHVLTPELYVGVVFLSALPSTVQSSIAFTSIARGNVAAALCAASASNLLGVLITPLLTGLLLSKQGVSFSGASLEKLVLQLLLPFFLGQLLRPLISRFVTRHKRVLSYVDRGSILLVVYCAFSEGVVAGIWQQVSKLSLALLIVVAGIYLAIVLGLSTWVSRKLGFAKADEITIVMCGSKKSLASGVPIASVLFPAESVGLVVLPLMLFHQIQLIVCAWLARRYAERES